MTRETTKSTTTNELAAAIHIALNDFRFAFAFLHAIFSIKAFSNSSFLYSLLDVSAISSSFFLIFILFLRNYNAEAIVNCCVVVNVVKCCVTSC